MVHHYPAITVAKGNSRAGVDMSHDSNRRFGTKFEKWKNIWDRKEQLKHERLCIPSALPFQHWYNSSWSPLALVEPSSGGAGTGGRSADHTKTNVNGIYGRVRGRGERRRMCVAHARGRRAAAGTARHVTAAGNLIEFGTALLQQHTDGTARPQTPIINHSLEN